MATTTYEEQTLTLIDGTKVTVRPLKISLLRPFMKKFEGVGAVAEDNGKSIDLPTVYKIVEAASGIKLAEVSDVLGVTMAE
jgi:hypothetical protein